MGELARWRPYPRRPIAQQREWALLGYDLKLAWGLVVSRDPAAVGGRTSSRLETEAVPLAGVMVQGTMRRNSLP